MVENKIKLGIVSNTNIDRRSEFKKILVSPFIDYFEITSKELNGGLSDFILPPTSLSNTDTGLKSLEDLTQCIANNVASANFALNLKSFTLDVMKYQSLLPKNVEGWEEFLQNLNIAIQELVFEKLEITIYLKGLEILVDSQQHTERFLRKWNEEINVYNDDDDTIVIFKPAVIIGRDSKINPMIISKIGTVYLSPTKIGKDFTFKEPIVRAWAVALLKAQRLSENPITIFYEDEISSVASIVNLIQVFKPDMREKIKELNLSGNIDELGV